MGWVVIYPDYLGWHLGIPQVKYFMGSLPEGEEGRWTQMDRPQGTWTVRSSEKHKKKAPSLCLLVYKPH